MRDFTQEVYVSKKRVNKKAAPETVLDIATRKALSLFMRHQYILTFSIGVIILSGVVADIYLLIKLIKWML